MVNRVPSTPAHEIGRIIHGTGLRKRYVVIHCTDSPADAFQGVINYFSGDSPQGVGAHFLIGKDKTVQMAPYDALCYHCPGGNALGIGFELTGEESDSKWAWRKRRKQRKLAANRVAWLHWKLGWGTPRRGKTVFGHGDFPPPNDHTDPGPNFPWVLFMAATRRSYRRLQRSHGKRWSR